MANITTFTIIKGEDLSFTILVKENGTLTPLVLSANDVFTYTLVDKKTGTVYIEDTNMTIADAENGKVVGTILGSVTTNLPKKVSMAEDFYMPRPNLRLIINGNSTIQGAMTAFIENVYVVEG